jgi:thiol-disulfide isomerase/thioredoxin
MQRRTFITALVPLAGAALTATRASAAPAAPLAPFIQSDVWINTQPLEWDSLRGRVVMVEFWTYGCINCRNVLPALKGMYADFRDEGFIILGVHSPEFDHERKLANVRKAVKDLGITYPVAIDNDFANWRRYRNRYWPALYLIDKRGVIRHTRIGEGGYAETREWISKLVSE